MAKIVSVCPSYDGRMDAGCSRSLHQTGSKKHDVLPLPNWSSLLTQNCNGLWCRGLNLRRYGFTWWAMLHADITPEEYYLDKLHDIAEHHQADFVSAMVPIKNDKGVSSTALAHPSNPWLPGVRLSMAQLHHPSFPKTFDVGGAVHALKKLPEGLRVDYPQTYLLANTGCCICRLDRKWATRVWFENHDRIEPLGDPNDLKTDWYAQAQSEDWWFSQRIAALGGKVMVTQEVVTRHRGYKDYRSDETWGRPIDPDFQKCNPER